MDMQMANVTDVENENQESRRIVMRPTVPLDTEKEVKRRKRFDSALDRFVTPEERDEIRSFQAKHGAGKYPKRFEKEVQEVEERKAAAVGSRRVQQFHAPKLATGAPKQASGGDIFTARMFAADLARTFTKEIADLPAEVQVRALELFEKKFLEYKNK
jgi:hypothetical protein